ncbi:hypothetical protein GW17_00022943 [Ensete ventricosum]|nr:hypothetical protein GW17_00022943 [Ensete ventricosum]
MPHPKDMMGCWFIPSRTAGQDDGGEAQVPLWRWKLSGDFSGSRANCPVQGGYAPHLTLEGYAKERSSDVSRSGTRQKVLPELLFELIERGAHGWLEPTIPYPSWPTYGGGENATHEHIQSVIQSHLGSEGHHMFEEEIALADDGISRCRRDPFSLRSPHPPPPPLPPPPPPHPPPYLALFLVLELQRSRLSLLMVKHPIGVSAEQSGIG